MDKTLVFDGVTSEMVLEELVDRMIETSNSKTPDEFKRSRIKRILGGWLARTWEDGHRLDYNQWAEWYWPDLNGGAPATVSENK